MENLENKEQLLIEVEKLKLKIAELEKSSSEHGDSMFAEREKRFLALYQNAPISYHSLNEDGVFLQVNDIWLKTLGYKKEEVIGKKYQEFLHLESMKIFEENFPKFKKQGFIRDVPFKLRHKDGHFIDILLDGGIGYTPTGEFKQTYCVFKDITKEHEIEKQLKESEGKFKSLATNSEEIVYMISKDGTFLLSEGKGLSKLGLKPGQVVGESLFDLYKDYPEMLDEMRRTFNGETITSEVKIGEIYFKNWYTPHKNNNGEIIGLLGLSVDVTEQKQAEEKLIISEERYHLATRASDNGIWDWWIEPNEVYYNDQWKAQLGYQPNELANEFKTWEDLLHPDCKERMIQKVMGFLENPLEYFIAEFRMKHKDGSYRWIYNKAAAVVNENKKVIRMFGAHTDITNRKLAEEALRISKERYDLAMKATKDGIFDWDLIDNSIYYSPGWKSMLGYEDKELPNDFSVWEKLTEPEDVRKSWKIQNEVLNKKRDHFEMEFKMKHKDGHWVDIHARSEPIFNENGDAVRMVGTHVDITERKKAEEELDKYREQLEELVKDRTLEIDEKNKKLTEQMKIFVGRELKIKDLQSKLNAIKGM